MRQRDEREKMNLEIFNYRPLVSSPLCLRLFLNSASARPRVRAFLFLRLCFLTLLFAVGIYAQDLPGEIRGYKVHRAKISVQNEQAIQNPSKETEAVVTFGDPVPIEVSLTNLIFELSGEIAPLKKGGRVDFLTFYDFRVNGLRVSVEEYQNSFELPKDRPFKLPKPLRISISFGQAMFGALGEWRDSKDTWQVTGRIFVFGRFKKFGFKFKRVIPVDVNLEIKNPLKR